MDHHCQIKHVEVVLNLRNDMLIVFSATDNYTEL